MLTMADQQGEQAAGERPGGRHAAPEDPDTTIEPADTAEPADSPTEVAQPAPSEVPTRDVRGASPADGEPTRQEEVPQVEPTRRMERPAGPPPPPPARTDGARRGVKRVLHGVATALRVVGLVLALVLVAFVVLTLVGVNPENGIAQLVAAAADALVMRFRDLFLPADPQLAVAVNYGVAALFWLLAGLVAARLVRTLARVL